MSFSLPDRLHNQLELVNSSTAFDCGNTPNASVLISMSNINSGDLPLPKKLILVLVPRTSLTFPPNFLKDCRIAFNVCF